MIPPSRRADAVGAHRLDYALDVAIAEILDVGVEAGGEPVAQKYGLSENQAEGGIGSILTLAKEKMKSCDYTQLASAIPGASNYVDKAKSLGAVTGKVGNREGLNAAFGKLGITHEVGSQLISTVVDYASKLGGGKSSALLAALK